MYRMKNKVNVKKNQSFTLNITSMTDMFTILLVFLLQSFASGQVEVRVPEKINVPTTKSDKDPTDVFQVNLNQNELSFDHKKFNLSEIKNNQAKIDSLSQELNAHFEEQTKKNKGKDALLIADRSVPSQDLKFVLNMLGQSGFEKVKFVAMAGQ